MSVICKGCWDIHTADDCLDRSCTCQHRPRSVQTYDMPSGTKLILTDDKTYKETVGFLDKVGIKTNEG